MLRYKKGTKKEKKHHSRINKSEGRLISDNKSGSSLFTREGTGRRDGGGGASIKTSLGVARKLYSAWFLLPCVWAATGSQGWCSLSHGQVLTDGGPEHTPTREPSDSNAIYVMNCPHSSMQLRPRQNPAQQRGILRFQISLKWHQG